MGGDKKEQKKAVTAEQTRANEQYNTLWQQQQSERADALKRDQDERANLNAQYNRIVGERGVNPDTVGRLRSTYEPYQPGSGGGGGGGEDSGGGGGGGGESGGGGGGGPVIPAAPLYDEVRGGFSDFSTTGGVDIGKLEESLGTFRDLAGKTGGFDEGRLANLQNVIKSYGDFAKTGGYDPETTAKINASIQNLTDIGNTGGFDPTQLAAIRGDIERMRGFGTSGGFDPAQLEKVRGDIQQLRELAASGGVSPEQRAQIGRAIENAEMLMKTGGMTPEDIERYRDKGYEEFANTGGYSPEMIQYSRGNALAPLRAQARGDQAALERSAQMSGYAPGLGAAIQSQRRGSAQSLGRTASENEQALQEAILKGRQYGITGRANQEQALQDLLQRGKLGGTELAGTLGIDFAKLTSGNTIQALAEAARTGGGLEEAIAKNRLSATESAARGAADLEQAIVGNKLTGSNMSATQMQNLQNSINDMKMRGLQGQELDLAIQQEINQTRLGAGQGIQQTQKGAQELVQGGKLAGLQGMFQVDQARQAAAEQAAAQEAASRAAAAQTAAYESAASAEDDYRNRNMAAQNERFIMGLEQGGEQFGMSGLSGLYGATSGPNQQNFENSLGVANNQSQMNFGNLGQQQQARQMTGTFDKIMQGVGTVGGAVGGIMGGLGNIIRPPTRQPFVPSQ